MAEVKDAIRNRRSCRVFTDEAVPKEAIDELLEAARWAPTGSGIQPWYFGVIQDAKKINEIQIVSPGINGNPPLILAMCVDKKRALEKGGELGRDKLSFADISMACQNVMLRAYDLGLGTCVIASFHCASVSRLLKLPENIVPELLITVGYPKRELRDGRRRELSEVTFYDVWEEQQ